MGGYWYFCANRESGFFVKADSIIEARRILERETGDSGWACVNALSPRAGNGKRVVPVGEARQKVARLPPWACLLPHILVDALNRYGFTVRD